MQVVVIDHHPLRDSRVSRHLQQCVKSGYDVFRIRLDEKMPFQTKQTIKDEKTIPTTSLGCNITKYGSVNSYIYTSLWSLIRYFNVENICLNLGVSFQKMTIIHVHDPILIPLAYKLSKSFEKSRIIYDRHEVYEKTKILSLTYPPYVYYFTEQRMRNKLDGIVTILDEYIPSVSALFPGKAVVAVPNYPPDRYSNKDAVMKKIDDFNINYKFVYVGSLDWNNDRDIQTILYIAESLLSKDYPVSFLIGGASDDERLLSEFSRLSKTYDSKFIYAGYMNHDDVVAETLSATFGFNMIKPDTEYWVLCSPNKVYEYLQAGVIPLIRANCANKEVLKECSLWFNPSDSKEEILSKIEYLLLNPLVIKRMMRATLTISEEFSFEKIAYRYNYIYESVFGENTRNKSNYLPIE